MTNRIRHVSAGMALLLCVAFSGCGSVKLHSDVREAQGKDAKKAWDEVKLGTYFDAERDNLAKLLTEEIGSTQRLAEVNRESEIRVVATTPVVALPCYFQVQLVKLVPPTGTQPSELCAKAGYYTSSEAITRLASLVDAWGNLRENRRELREIERASSFLLAMGVPSFTCEQLRAKPPVEVNAWKNANSALAKSAASRIKTLADLCDDADKQRTDYLVAIGAMPSGELKNYVDDWERARTALGKHEKDVASAKVIFALAKKQYDDEVAKATPGKAQVDKAKELAPKLAEILQAVETAQTVLGKEWASEERLKRINDLLSNLESGGDFNSDTASKAELVAAMLPTIADDVVAIGQSKKGAGVVSLLIQRDIEQGNLNTAKVLAAIQQKDLALREAIVEAALEQAITYLKSVKQSAHLVTCANEEEVGDAAKCRKAQGDKRKNNLHQAWDAYAPVARKNLLESTTLYLDAFARQQVKLHTMTTQYLALARERTLAVSEVHAAMWSSMIGASVNQAADYAALGLKAEDFEKLFNVVGLFYIGHGVNK